MKKIDILKLITLAICCCSGKQVWAACQQVDWQTGVYYTGFSNSRTITQTEDGHAAKIRVGNIHLMDIAIQPIGSVLAQASVPPTEYKIRNANAESLLWACTAGTDMSKIRFLTSVNGDDRVGGFFPVDPSDAGGQTNVYYTWFAGVGIRQVMNGVTLAPQWTELPIQYETGTGGTTAAKDRCQTGWYCIRLKHLPILQFELVRVAGLPPYSTSTGGTHNKWCTDQTPSTGVSGDLRDLGQYGNYDCPQPSSYITLGHTGTAHTGGNDDGDNFVSFPHDTVGVTHGYSDTTYNFWGADNGFGYTLYNAARLVNNVPACKLNMVTPTVDFNSTTTSHLNSGNVVSRNFEVQVDCQNTAVSGTSANQMAIGIQPSQQAYNAIKNNPLLSLYNGDTTQSVKALVDNNYGATGVAQNVGIYIKYQGAGSYLTLLGQPGATGTLPASTRDVYAQTCGPSNNQYCYPAVTYPQGNTAGWYPVLNSGHYTNIGTPLTGYTRYRINYTADLKKIDGTPVNSVTAGTINSTAYVVVKIQ
ncbi:MULTISPECIES: fimbrial protein [unclassified Acinetobacter]|uniref:fimbrial protein n=1 Tax=unclassified Acinetobacter TaxID=196816 RepID=UPI00244879F7|nr:MULTISPECIES: fimbrial protein [unclassified Acinetobacter]MDH0031305.1 fimbrial protein [Acinetobacter sp. GD04021]MDH0887050.1 fimbrial protein [Acinetobacter sp. GD03873]MDH1083501.1 fimbrial protein [Acinetobacter sp. GD03983]MDH2190366.1 fimbrial protein [Acinetobacter sp. GD03645]MDH2203691.1 fimbrial protein [Acinetobacter sp. GD03647]